MENLENYIHFSNPVRPEELEQAYLQGMLRKSELENGAIYQGRCRNASRAVWAAEKQRFIYERHKFSRTYEETLPHPEDDDGFDIFIPMRKIN